MEKPPEQEKVEKLDILNSPIREAYILLGAKTPLELSNLYSAEDQKLMRSRSWDYNNPELIVNKIKDILESVDPRSLTEDEREWRQEILWFWNHHAISCALWRYKDRDGAKMYVTRALEYQTPGHPNKITKILDFLISDKVQDAEKFAKTITEEPEKGTATFLIEEYKEGRFL